jgi:hypothetical protein
MTHIVKAGSLCLQVEEEEGNPTLVGLLERASLCHLGLVGEHVHIRQVYT